MVQFLIIAKLIHHKVALEIIRVVASVGGTVSKIVGFKIIRPLRII